jgi:hypothetical protein
MDDIWGKVLEFTRGWTGRGQQLARSPRMRKIGLIALIVLAVFTLAGVFAVPPILRHVLKGSVAASLHRPVEVGRISFNPLRLILNVDQLHIGDRESGQPFVDVGHLRVKASWSSILHLAPIVGQIEIDHPAIHVVRSGEQEFNFSDLIAPSAPPKPNAPSKPFRFAVYNVQLKDGEVRFDDKVLNQQHRIDHIRIGLPFVANLPSDLDVFVQPLLEMVIDGSPLRLTGRAKPFVVPMESDLDLNLHKFDLPPYLGYVPRKLPIKMPSGTLSCNLQIQFVNAPTRPVVRVGGEVALDKIDVRDEANAPLAGFSHFNVTLKDVEPLQNIVHLGKIRINEFNGEIVRNAGGTTNLTALTRESPAPVATPQAQATPSIAAATMTPSPTPTAGAPSMVSAGPVASPAATPSSSAAASGGIDVALDSLELSDSTVRLTDKSGAAPAILSVQNIHVGLQDFRTVEGGSAPYEFGANLGGGGAIAVKGALDLAKREITSDISATDVDLPAFQAFAQPVLAATIASGKLNAHGKVLTHLAGDVVVHAEPAGVSLDNFKLNAPNGETPVQWNRFSVEVAQADSAAHRATVSQVQSDGLRLMVKRSSKGELNLLDLAKNSAQPGASGHPEAIAPARVSRPRRARHPSHPAPAPPPSPPGASSGWQYEVQAVALEKAEVQVDDETTQRPVKLVVAPLNVHLKDVSSDFTKPFTLDLDAIFNQKGSLKVTGTTALTPLKTNLHVTTKRLDLAFGDPYLAKRLNASFKSAALSMDGTLDLAKVHDDVRVGYRGDATLGNVRMLDRLTGDNFLSWNALSIRRIDAGVGGRSPRVHIGGISLANFYARVILDRSGRLNLSDITSNGQAAPKSLTRNQNAVVAQGPAATPSPTPTATPSPSAAASPSPGSAPAPVAHPIDTDIELDRITLQGGHVNYSDNFIKPNYSADLTEIGGKIGAFGTRTTTPADVALQGQVNGSAPISINGSINPLAPLAFVDIGAKANGIELTSLTPYSAKYTGYPIVKGTLNVDVHYLLDKGNLSANNHILIDQFTFGDRVESKDAINLPVRLAVALLKNSKGQIDLTIPVSGSLSDPQFSIGTVIWQTFKNLIVRAATSPFSLIASAFGGGNQDLGYVEFAPGYAILTPDSVSRLTTVAKALQDRTGLRLGIQGRVDPELDRAGLREAKVEQLVEAQAQDAGVAADAKLTPEQYDKYLKRVYKAASFPKPRDFVGLNKSLPPAEMKKLLITNTEVNDQDLKQLADARANAVRQWMSKQVDPGRLFIVPAELDAKGIGDKGKTTRVGLSLQ